MDITTGLRLASLRKENGYSQEALAEKLGISRQAVSKWERGESSPDTDNLISLAALYSMTLDELLGMGLSADATESSAPQPENSDNNSADIAAESSSEVKHRKRIRIRSTREKRVRERKPALYPVLAHRLLLFPFPLILGAVYVGLGYYTGQWHPLWLIMTLVPVYYWFALACRARTKRGFLMGMPVLLLTALVYLAFGVLGGGWLKPLMLFLTVPIYYWLAAAYGKKSG